MGTTRTCSSCGDEVSGTLGRCPRDGTPLFSPEVMARVGMLLKDHEIQGVIGEGGMGVVYRAQHVVIEKPVAIKVLYESFARRREMVEQFIVEAKAASRIRHPNVIDVTDFGTTPDGSVFLVMEYLEGESLQTRLERVGRLPVFEAINIVKQVARGLGAAHGLGVIHRDLKPANIFLCRREGRRRIVRRTADAQFTIEPERSFDFVKLLDFGVAKFLDLGPGAVTRAGGLCGSPYYLSPEQAQEKPATERSDIYALGATLYEMVTGTVPFDGASMFEILNGHVAGVVEPPSRRAPDAGIDAHLDAIILRCLAKEPEARFAGTDEIGEALRGCVTDRAFLRDADRLPGIRESGLDLSDATAEARRGGGPQGLERGFSEVEDGRQSMSPDDDRRTERPGKKRFSGNTVRIPRQQTGRWAALGVLLVALIGGALWLGRARSGRAVATMAAAPPAAVPAPTPAAPPAPIPAPVVAAVPTPVHAPTGLGSPAAEPTGLPAGEGSHPAAPGKPLARGADRSVAARRGSSALPPVRLPSLPPLSESVAVASPPPAPSPAAAPPPEPVAPAPAGDVEALLREAQQAWSRQHYAVAIDKAREVLKADPHRQVAHQIVAVCSCAIGAADDAREAASHLDEHKRKLVQTLCQHHGVTLE